MQLLSPDNFGTDDQSCGVESIELIMVNVEKTTRLATVMYLPSPADKSSRRKRRLVLIIHLQAFSLLAEWHG